MNEGKLSGRILIAEDNATIAETLAMLLRRAGLQVDHAADGATALTRLLNTPPDLLLLDLRLPRLHGIELLKKLRLSEKTRTLPVIIMSGVYRGEKHRAAAGRLGVTTYLEKPFRAKQLLEAVRDQLNLPQRPAGQLLDRHLASAYGERFSGRLKLQADGRRHVIDFLQGRPVHLAPGFAHSDFICYLKHRGLLSEDEFNYVRHTARQTPESLVELGYLRFAELQEEKLAYLGSELLVGFAAGPLEAERRPGPFPTTWQLPAVNLPRLLHEGFKQHPQPQQCDRLLQKAGLRYAGLGDNYYRYINFLHLNETELKLVGQFNGQQQLNEISHALRGCEALLLTFAALSMLKLETAPFAVKSPADRPLRQLFNTPLNDPTEALESEPDVAEELETFADLTGENQGPPLETPFPMAEQGDTQTGLTAEVRSFHKALQGKNYYQIFDLRQADFSMILLKERYFKLTHKFGPEVLMLLGGQEAALTEEILASVTTAYNTLSDVVKKERYDELLNSDKIGLGDAGDDRFQAQVQFQAGQVFIQMQEWDNAEQALQDACTIDPNSGRYLTHLAWCIYKNPKNRDSQAMQNKARQLLARSLTLERTAEAFAFKGWMYFDAGQHSLAESEFNKALKLDARQLLARQGLRDIREKREQEKKGLFSRMFRGATG